MPARQIVRLIRLPAHWLQMQTAFMRFSDNMEGRVSRRIVRWLKAAIDLSKHNRRSVIRLQLRPGHDCYR